MIVANAPLVDILDAAQGAFGLVSLDRSNAAIGCFAGLHALAC